MKLSTERNLLFAYTPMDVHNPHKSKLKLPLADKVIGTTIHERSWGAEEFMCMDCVIDILRIAYYGNKIPSQAEVSARLLDTGSATFDSSLDTECVDKSLQVRIPKRLTHQKLVARYPFLGKYSPAVLHSLFEKTSGISLTCRYRYKTLFEEDESAGPGKRKTKKTWSTMKYPFEFHVPQTFFNIDFDPRDVSYEFSFTSGLGVLLARNVVACEWEWVPSELYSLSRNAQNIHRKYMLIRKKGTEIRLSYRDIAHFLKLDTPNQTAKRKSIERYLQELADIGFLEYKVERGYKDFIFSLKKLVSN